MKRGTSEVNIAKGEVMKRRNSETNLTMKGKLMKRRNHPE